MSRLNYIYKRLCSCCGNIIIKDEFEDRVIPEDNKESEGNLCAKHYYEEQRQNWYEEQKMISLVSASISNPISRFSFIHKSRPEQRYDCQKLLEMGAISYIIK